MGSQGGDTPFRRAGVLGAVLAGGRSSRFGAPKPLATFRGEPLVAHAIAALTPVCGDVVVVTHLPEIGIALGARTLTDRLPDAGPLAGLASALGYARALRCDGVLLLACDMPLVTPALLALLVDEARAHHARAAVGLAGPRGVQPLCGWYSVECLDAVETRLEGGDRSLRSLLAAVGAHLVPHERMSALCDLRVVFRGANTPGELSALEELVRGDRPEPARGREHGRSPEAPADLSRVRRALPEADGGLGLDRGGGARRAAG
jgi:molybdopterin-guanine dinucleotide biosynthesis protein A